MSQPGQACLKCLQGIESDEALVKSRIEDRQVDMDRWKDLSEHTGSMADALTDCVKAAPECLNQPLTPGLEEVGALQHSTPQCAQHILNLAKHTMATADALTDCVKGAPECLNQPLTLGLEEVGALQYSTAQRAQHILNLAEHTGAMTDALTDCVKAAPEYLNQRLTPGLEEVGALQHSTAWRCVRRSTACTTQVQPGRAH